MSLSKLQVRELPLIPMEPELEKQEGNQGSFGTETVIVTAELEDFMRRLCNMIDEHPEWVDQDQPERMDNFLRAVQQL